MPLQLDGERTHPAGASLNEQPLTGRKLTHGDKASPSTQADKGNRGRLDMRKRRRLVSDICEVNGNEFGVGATPCPIAAHAKDRIAAPSPLIRFW
jgi:hypothetical protein